MTQMINKIELTFWKVTIPLLSESRLVRSAYKNVYVIAQRKEVWGSLVVFSFGAAGLITGYFLGHSSLLH